VDAVQPAQLIHLCLTLKAPLHNAYLLRGGELEAGDSSRSVDELAGLLGLGFGLNLYCKTLLQQCSLLFSGHHLTPP
jgi:hypothetical protein